MRINPPSQYNVVTSTPAHEDGHERGDAILIDKKIKYETITLNTNQQVVAVKLFLNRIYTVCNMHLPHVRTNKADII